MIFNNHFKPRYTKIYIGCIWLYGLVWFCVYMVPDVEFLYSNASYFFFYASSPLSDFVKRAESYNDITCATMVLVWYIVISIKLRINVSFCFEFRT